MTGLALLGESAWKATIILTAGFAAAAMLRVASAAVRHFMWTSVLLAVLVLPAMMAVTPHWGIRPVVQAAAPAPIGTTIVVRGARQAAWNPAWLLLVWGIGGALAYARFLWGAVGVRSLRQRSVDAAYARPLAEAAARGLGIRRSVAVLECAGAPVPLACGILRPAVLLPRGAADWPSARLENVLLHELMHIRRWDLSVQILAQAVCCLYWFHPLAWLAARQLRHERERACDDAVLLGGVPPQQYATDLMELARGMAGQHLWAGASFGLGKVSELESRIRALFDARRREPLRPRAALGVAIAVAAVLLPVAAVTVHAQGARGILVGAVEDPSAARVSNCRVTARNQDAANQEITQCDPAGEYRFAAIPPGHYTLVFASPGFAPATVSAVVTANQSARRRQTSGSLLRTPEQGPCRFCEVLSCQPNSSSGSDQFLYYPI